MLPVQSQNDTLPAPPQASALGYFSVGPSRNFDGGHPTGGSADPASAPPPPPPPFWSLSRGFRAFGGNEAYDALTPRGWWRGAGRRVMATGWDWEPVRAAAAAALGVAPSELTIMGADDDDEVSDVGPPAVQLFLGSVGWQLVSNAHMDSERYLVCPARALPSVSRAASGMLTSRAALLVCALGARRHLGADVQRVHDPILPLAADRPARRRPRFLGTG